MYPRAIIRKAREEKLDIIGICDHNSSENVASVQRAASGHPLTVLPGMEVSSREEVHILALFDNTSRLQQFQKIIYDNLPGENDENVFGCQAIVNEEDEVEGFNQRLLIGATILSLQEIIDHIHRLGGLAIASHIDRESFSVIGQLGFIAPAFSFDALEVTPHLGLARAREVFPELSDYSFITSSDAHFLCDIGRTYTELWMEAGNFQELGMALRGEAGRYIIGGT